MGVRINLTLCPESPFHLASGRENGDPEQAQIESPETLNMRLVFTCLAECKTRHSIELLVVSLPLIIIVFKTN